MNVSVPQLSALQDSLNQFLELYPNRGGSLVKHETGNWREVSRFYDLPDNEIVRAISSAQTLVRAANWDIRTKFTVLNVNAESIYHNQLSLWQLQNCLGQKGVHKTRVYQSSESSGWHIYIFWNDWVGSTRSAAVISAILMAAGFEIAPETLEVFPSNMALRLPLQSGFSWLNESGRVIVRRSEISLEGALALYLDEVVKFANEAAWLDSDHANEVAQLFQQQRAVLRVVKPMAPASVAEPARSEQEEQEAASSDLIAEETSSSDFIQEDFRPEPVVDEAATAELEVQETFFPYLVAEETATIEEYSQQDSVAEETATIEECTQPNFAAEETAIMEDFAPELESEETLSVDFDAEDTLSPELVAEASPLTFSTNESTSEPESAVDENWTLDQSAQASFAADDVVTEKTCSQNPAFEVDELEFTADQTVSPEMIAERVWTPELVAEEAWPLELAEDSETSDPTGADTSDAFWNFQPAVSENAPSASVDEEYPPVVEQIMQIRQGAPQPISQQLSLPLQNIDGNSIEPEVVEAAEAPLSITDSSSNEPEEESIDFSPAKVVNLPQRASGIVRELVENEIPEIAYDMEAESESQSQLKSENNSWAGPAKHSNTKGQDSSLLHGKQRLNNVVGSGQSDPQRRKRPPRNTTKQRPAPGFPPTQP